MSKPYIDSIVYSNIVKHRRFDAPVKIPYIPSRDSCLAMAEDTSGGVLRIDHEYYRHCVKHHNMKRT